MERRRPPQIALLKQKSPLSVGAQLAIRFLLLLALLAVIILVHWIERDAFVDNVDGEMSFADVIYFTMISATTTGYGDIVPVTARARLFDALVVTPARIFLSAQFQKPLSRVFQCDLAPRNCAAVSRYAYGNAYAFQ